ncbi:MAG: hypothetical protein ABJL44_19095 [Algibacter sp.]
MLESLKTYLLFGNQFCGIEHTTKNGAPAIYATVLKKSKKEVDIKEIFSLSSTKSIAEKLSKNQHIFLIINNDHVLTKALSSQENDDLKLLNTAFPNTDTSVFYYEIIKQNDLYFISICRQVYIDNLIKEYAEKGLSIINFSLGHSILTHIVNYLDDDVIFTSNASVSISNKVIKSIDITGNSQEAHYNINGIDTPNNYVLTVSGALGTLLNSYKPQINYLDKTSHLINDYKQKRFFNQFVKMGLILILSTLLINFIFFNFYFEKTQTLNETSQINQTTKQQILKLNESVTKAKKMTEDMLKSSASKSSFYINAITNSLPNSILLSQINYQPLEKKIKEGKTISLQKNTMTVSGSSNNSNKYSKWISTLESMNWIETIEILDYSDSKSSSNFSIKINLTNDK